ncbi:MAG TPA: aspartyl protease family protein, partial [Lacipirellulaceae bacterium]|nr:aspartyl protease family protein [Lacipirellulaceae bacterium]
MLLPVNMHGARYFFEVDTGATRLCFDRSLRPMLGMVRESETIGTLGGPLRCELFEAPDALLGPLHLRLPPPGVTPLVACLDQEHRRLGSGHDVRGIIGTNFLRRHVVRIDFDRGKLSFLKAVGKEPGRPVPILFDEGKREVQARLPGMGDSMFLIDTGL